MPEVSIVLPSFNSENFIGKTLISVINQTFLDWELIVIDDCSSDGTVEVVKRYMAGDSRIRLLENDSNQGAAVTRNKGIASSKGRYLAFIDSDDQWDKVKLRKQLGYMKDADIAFCYTKYSIQAAERCEVFIDIPASLTRHELLKNNRICTSTVIIDTDVFGRITMPLIRRGQDLAFWLVLLKFCGRAHLCDHSLTMYIKREHSLSSNKFTSARWVWLLYRDIEKMSFFTTSFYFINYAINGVIKHYKGFKIGKK